MKTHIFFSIVLSMAVACTVEVDAQNAVDTVAVIEDAHEVIVSRSEQGMKVNVSGSGDNADYHYTYSNHQRKCVDTTKVCEDGERDWNLRLPFVKDDKGDIKIARNRGHLDLIMGGLFVGCQKGVGSDGGVVGNSCEFGLEYVLGLAYNPWRKGPSFSLGFGIDWNHFRLKAPFKYNVDYATGAVSIGTFEESQIPHKSDLTVFSLQVPFNIKQNFPYKFYVSLGATLNFNTHASVRSIYDKDDVRKEVYCKQLNQRKVTYDLTAKVGWSFIGLYVKYSPMSVFKLGFGPQFKPLSVGTVLFF